LEISKDLDLLEALGNLKGFGSSFGQDFGKIPDINITIPDFGLPEVFADTGKAVEQAGIDIGQFGADVQTNINTAITEAQKTIDTSIKGTQENFEQFGKDVQTNIGIIGEGLTSVFGGIFPTKEITTISETTPSIVTSSRRSGTTTRFGGQTAPKEVLTKTTASTPELIISEQPDLSLVSPFLTSFQKVEEKPEAELTGTRFSGSGSRR